VQCESLTQEAGQLRTTGTAEKLELEQRLRDERFAARRESEDEQRKHTAAIDRMRHDLVRDHDAAVEALHRERSQEVGRLREEHDATLSRIATAAATELKEMTERMTAKVLPAC
jgi:hypothetical protein